MEETQNIDLLGDHVITVGQLRGDYPKFIDALIEFNELHSVREPEDEDELHLSKKELKWINEFESASSLREAFDPFNKYIRKDMLTTVERNMMRKGKCDKKHLKTLLLLTKIEFNEKISPIIKKFLRTFFNTK